MEYEPYQFWNNGHIASDYIKRNYPFDLEWWKEIKKIVDQKWNVLEVGCGTGIWSTKFKHYTGCDISEPLIDEARLRYPCIKFFQHDARDKLTGDYDLIFSFRSLLHTPYKDIRKVKFPDTRLLIVEPHIQPTVEYCFKHDYEKIFGVKKLLSNSNTTMYGKGL